MSIAVMSKVWKTTFGSSKKFVLLALADFANDDGLCWPSYQKLAEKCSASRRHIINAMNFFIENGIVSKKEFEPSSSLSRPNLFQINVDILDKFINSSELCAPLQTQKKAKKNTEISLGSSEQCSPVTSYSSESDSLEADLMGEQHSLGGEQHSPVASEQHSLGGEQHSLIIRTINDPSIITIKEPSDISVKIPFSEDEQISNPSMKKNKPRKKSKKNIPEEVLRKFEMFWELYPRKEARGDAKERFAKIILEDPNLFEKIIEGLKRQMPVLKSKEYKFLKLPATWLNKECWSDDVPNFYQNQGGKTKDDLRREKTLNTLLSTELT